MDSLFPKTISACNRLAFAEASSLAVARQLRDSRPAMFLCQLQDLPGFFREVSCMHNVSHKVIYIVLQFSGNSPVIVCLFLRFLLILSKGWSK